MVLDATPLNSQEKNDFVNQLRTNFADAELWRQLGLRCSISLQTDTNFTSNESNRINLTLTHIEAVSTAARGFKNQIIANTRPPSGVPTADLQEINIIWALSPTTSSSSDLDSKRLKYEASLDHSKEFESLLDGTDSYGYLSLSQPSQILPFFDMELDHVWSSSMPVINGTNKQAIDEAVERHQEIPIMPLPSSQASSAQLSQRPQPPHMHKKRSRSFSSPLFDLSAARGLIDVAFHAILSGRNVTDISTISQRKAVARPKLAEISPALFSPGYLQAMSCQSQSISHIAHSMASVNRRTKSKSLKEAFALLWATGPATTLLSGSPPPSEAHAHSEALASVIKARAWMITQKLLFEPGAAHKLKPLAYSVSQSPEEPVQKPSECSSPATLTQTPKHVSSPAPAMLDDFCLFDDDFEPLLEESDDQLLLDEYDKDRYVWENNPSQTSYTSSNGLWARHPMPQMQHRDPSMADANDTTILNNREQSEFPDILDVFSNDSEKLIDNVSPFMALDTPSVSRIGAADKVDILSDLDVEEMLLDDPSSDGLLDNVELLDDLSG
ncbi:hypothetical protein MMC11_004936 [Xylographa trunciseda]|nr:hypothetical protein [Xylographa trunciseda]